MAKESYISKINNTKIFAERAEYTKGGKNIDNMVEKVASATSGNLAAFDANGGLVDSNQAAANLVHDASYVHTDSNFTVAEKNKLNGIESGAQVNVIETVKVNGTTQTVTSKAIDISVPTAGTSNPSMDGTASAGSATTWSKSDHVHPTDTSREATANKDSSIPSSPVSGHYPSTEAVLQFVNSSISTNTANFLGTYDVVTDLGLTTSATNAQIASALNSYTFPAGTTVTNNDYVFVSINYSTTTDVDEYRRFKYSDASNGSWAYEYTLNNSSFTQAQWDAINSAITSTKVGNYDTHIANTNNPHGVTKAQVGLGNVGNFLAVSTDANQGLTDTQKVNARANIGAGTYVKPNDGIPKTDLASGVQTSLGKADTAYQKPNGGIPDSDIASASTWNAKQDALPTTGSASTTYAINVSGKAATAGTVALRMDSPTYIDISWANVSWSDFCGAGANSLLQKVFGSNYDSVWRTITVIGRIEACPVDFEANTGISASAMNYGNFIGVKSRDAMFVKFFTNAKHNNGQYPIYEITFGLSASSGISGIRSIMKNVVISSATQSLPGGSGSATKPVYTDQRGELKPCSSELPNGYGTSGQYLKSNGANNAPSWDDTSNINAGSVNGYSIDVRIGGTPGSDPNTIYFC